GGDHTVTVEVGDLQAPRLVEGTDLRAELLERLRLVLVDLTVAVLIEVMDGEVLDSREELRLGGHRGDLGVGELAIAILVELGQGALAKFAALGDHRGPALLRG